MISPNLMHFAGTPDSSWCALYTRHQHEKTVADLLARKDFEVFLPVYDSARTWKDRKKIVSVPLFPCYVFLRGWRDRRLPIVSTPGVHMILSNGDGVAMIPDSEIQSIRKMVEGPERVEPFPFLKCGQRVRVRRGSLEGVAGILVRKKNHYRLVLSVDLLAQSISVEVDANNVEPLDDCRMEGARARVAQDLNSDWIKQAESAALAV